MYRKSRVEARTSQLPKPRLTQSIERRSVEARSVSKRSISVEHLRTGGPRLSRDASASKIPLNRKSKSQQALNDRLYSLAVTPLRTNDRFSKAPGTPRTPSQDRGHNWQSCVERVLAFVTHRDQRPISDVSWQRMQNARVSAELEQMAEGGGGGGGGMSLVRPLTIARFVNICSVLLQAIAGTKLSNENYIVKLPNQAKRFLYPGAVSKSWLKTVNTLHAFPQALAIISYFVDLANHIELPISEESMYRDKEPVVVYRRNYVTQCWLMFGQDDKYEHFDEEYVRGLSELVGDNAQAIQQLQALNQELEASLNDDSEKCLRVEEERIRSKRDAVLAAVKAVRMESHALREGRVEGEERARRYRMEAAGLDGDIAALTGEIEQLKQEVSSQPMSVSQRAQLVAEAQYAAKVADSKRTLLEQLSNLLYSKETELSSWQQVALDSCVQYKSAVINLSARHPDIADIAIDEKELMSESCAASLQQIVSSLRHVLGSARDQRQELQRAKGQRQRTIGAMMEETRASVDELESEFERESAALEAEEARDSAANVAWVQTREEFRARREQLKTDDEAFAYAQHQLDHWERQDALWKSKLSELREYTDRLREEMLRKFAAHKRATTDRVLAMADKYNKMIDKLEIKIKERK